MSSPTFDPTIATVHIGSNTIPLIPVGAPVATFPQFFQAEGAARTISAGDAPAVAVMQLRGDTAHAADWGVFHIVNNQAFGSFRGQPFRFEGRSNDFNMDHFGGEPQVVLVDGVSRLPDFGPTG